MNSDTAQLHIIRTRDSGDSPAVGTIATAAALSGLRSVEDWIAESEPAGGRIESILAHAASTTDPVLVVPNTQELETRVGEPEVTRMLVPIDLTADERRLLRPWIEKALDLGMDVEQVHVLTDRTRPPIWEGPGHHAEAWRAALKLRHQTPGTALSVCSGDPAAQIVNKSLAADLVLTAWRGSTASGRSAVMHRLLTDLSRPVLLVRRVPKSSVAPAEPVAE